MLQEDMPFVPYHWRRNPHLRLRLHIGHRPFPANRQKGDVPMEGSAREIVSGDELA